MDVINITKAGLPGLTIDNELFYLQREMGPFRMFSRISAAFEARQEAGLCCPRSVAGCIL